jgi:PhzF family phenazine biosynthesis protein
MKLPFYWIDAFASRVFQGNPAGVVPLQSWPEDRLMQMIAFENGLAETAFFVPTGSNRYHLRWFAPRAEVDLCGHATLAAAFVVFNELTGGDDSVVFDSRSGPLPVTRKDGGLLEMDFPALEILEVTDQKILEAAAVALGIKPEWLGTTPFDLLAILDNAGRVKSVTPKMDLVAALGGRGLIVTAAGEGDADFVSRFFAPQVGIPEDPVTGSAHCALVPLWAKRMGKTTFAAVQVSARTGRLQCALDGNRVKIAGSAVLYLRGEIEV